MITIEQGVFLVLAGVTLVGALAMVALRNMVHSVLAMILAFVGVAGLYMLLEAEFLAAVQVLIYVGAVAVLVLFAVMLTARVTGHGQRATNRQWWLALAIAVAFFLVLLTTVQRVPWPALPAGPSADLIPALGQQFLTTYVLPFEVASVILLMALVGAIILARE